MGHEILKIADKKRENDRIARELFPSIVRLLALSEEEQRREYLTLAEKYGKSRVLRLCCDLVMVIGAENVPLAIWDFAAGKWSRSPRLPASCHEAITWKQMTRLFRNCIVRESWNGERYVARQKR